MDFTPPSSSSSNPILQQPNPISSIPPPSANKLPIKRKTPSSSSSDLILTPHFDDVTRHPPFKFHRIWTEPDEIRFLQGLLDCSSQGFSFPRDLGIYYARFSHSMSQPYSKSQLSEKLRRLRKKFRVISSRLSKGLDKSLLSPQDRALYDLSKQLWDPDINRPPSLPAGVTNFNCKHKVSYSQTFPSASTAILALPSVVKKTDTNGNGNNKSNSNVGGGRDVKNGFSVDMNAELERNAKGVRNEVRVKSGNEVRVKSGGGDGRNEVVRIVTKTLADVLDESIKEIKMMIDVQGFSKKVKVERDLGFEKRWREQRMLEFDVLAKRMKLIVERSSSSVVSK